MMVLGKLLKRLNVFTIGSFVTGMKCSFTTKAIPDDEWYHCFRKTRGLSQFSPV